MAKGMRKTAVPTPVMPGKNGGLLRRGGPNGGAGGRPPDEFKALLASLSSHDETVRQVRAILKDRNHPHFMKALQYATDRGYPELNVAPKDVTPDRTLRVIHEHVMVPPRMQQANAKLLGSPTERDAPNEE